MKRSQKAYFLYGFILFTYSVQLQLARCWLQWQWQLGLLGAAFPHCAARTLFIVPGKNTSGIARALGALESAGADNNSYMWHDEFLATRRSFLLVSLSSHTPGHFLWTQLGRKTDKETEREREGDLQRAAINKRCHCRSSVVTCSFSCVSFSLASSFCLCLCLCLCLFPAVAFVLCLLCLSVMHVRSAYWSFYDAPPCEAFGKDKASLVKCANLQSKRSRGSLALSRILW